MHILSPITGLISIVECSGVVGAMMPAEDDIGRDDQILRRITLVSGLIAATIGTLGLAGLAYGITIFTSVLPGYKTIAVSAAIIWIVLGIGLAIHAARLHTGRLVLIVRAVLVGIVILETIELLFSLTGGNSVVELLLVRVGSAFLGNPTTPISPAASAMIIPSGAALFFLLAPVGTQKQKWRIQDTAGVTGLAVTLIAFTFVLSYLYGAPLLYNTPLIPIALLSASAGFFTGAGLVAAAGPAAIPLKYFSGSSTRARLLRIFVPFVIILIVTQNLVFVVISDVFLVQDALLLSFSIVVFGSITAWIIELFSGRIGRDLQRAERALGQKNEDLVALNEELTTMSEELRQNNDELLWNEEALRESQRRNTFLADILNKGSQPFAVGYPEGKLGIVNQAFEELTGYSAEELSEIDWRFLTPPEWQEHEQKSLAELNQTGRPVRYEKEYIRKDGSRVAIELLVQLVISEGGGSQYYYSFITDISEKKRAEKILKQKHDDLNNAYEELKLAQEELRQANIYLGVHEEVLVKKNQDLHTMNEKLTAAHEDLTQAGEEVRRSEERYRTLFSSMTEGFALHEIVCDADDVPVDYRFLDINPAFENLTGLPRDRIVGKLVSEVLPGLGREWIETYGKVALTGSPVRFDNYAVPLDQHYEVYSYSPAPRQFAVLFSDITDRKRAEKELVRKNQELNVLNEELNATQDELRQIVEELGRSETVLRIREECLKESLAEKEVLLSEVHHRVKNNLTAFISLLSLESTYDNSPAGLALKTDLQNRARSMALIHETLYRTKTYSQVDMDLYLSTLVEQIIHSYESAISVKTELDTHGITFDLSRATPCGLIINELITNSLKYAFPASFDCKNIRNAPCTIRVNLTGDDGAYILSVRDNGIGLPKDFNSTTTKTLGLKLVNFLAKHQLRASIEVYSDEGVEFLFKFRDRIESSDTR